MWRDNPHRLLAGQLRRLRGEQDSLELGAQLRAERAASISMHAVHEATIAHARAHAAAARALAASQCRPRVPSPAGTTASRAPAITPAITRAQVEVFKFTGDAATDAGAASSPAVVRACVTKLPPGYARVEVAAMSDAIWGLDGFDT